MVTGLLSCQWIMTSCPALSQRWSIKPRSFFSISLGGINGHFSVWYDRRVPVTPIPHAVSSSNSWSEVKRVVKVHIVLCSHSRVLIRSSTTEPSSQTLGGSLSLCLGKPETELDYPVWCWGSKYCIHWQIVFAPFPYCWYFPVHIFSCRASYLC